MHGNFSSVLAHIRWPKYAADLPCTTSRKKYNRRKCNIFRGIGSWRYVLQFYRHQLLCLVPFLCTVLNPRHRGFYCSFEVNFYSGLIQRPDNELNLRPVLRALGPASHQTSRIMYESFTETINTFASPQSVARHG
jgi:hypothetical protein